MLISGIAFYWLNLKSMDFKVSQQNFCYTFSIMVEGSNLPFHQVWFWINSDFEVFFSIKLFMLVFHWLSQILLPSFFKCFSCFSRDGSCKTVHSCSNFVLFWLLIFPRFSPKKIAQDTCTRQSKFCLFQCSNNKPKKILIFFIFNGFSSAFQKG